MSLMLAHQRKIKEQGTATDYDPGKGTRVAVVSETRGGKIGAQQLAEFLSNALAEDLHVLKGFNSVQRKIEYKQTVLVSKYKEYVDRLMAANQDHELLSYYLIWLLDAGEIDEAVSFGLYCAEKDISLPERFKTDLKTFFVGEVCKWAEDQLAANKSTAPYLPYVFSTVDAADWDIADAVTAHLYKCMGFQAEQDEKFDQAASYLIKALEMGAQVKTRLDKIRKKLT